MGKLPAMVVAVLLLGIGAYYEGTWTERWARNKSEKLEEFTKRLMQVPKVVGSWEGTDNELSEKDLEQFQKSNCRGYISRRYRNKVTQEQIEVYLVSGTARHITIHTPDQCYRGAGYEVEGDTRTARVAAGESTTPFEFTTATFHKGTPERVDRLQIYWSFTEDGKWQGPRHPKSNYAQKPALFKIYLITPLSERRTEKNTTTDSFAEVFMPAVNQVLFPSGPSEGEATSPAQPLSDSPSPPATAA